MAKIGGKSLDQKSINVLSLGAGVQSSTLAFMADRGLIDVDFAVFADTGHEPSGVYEWLEYLKSEISYPIYVVQKGDLAKDSLRLKVSGKSNKIYSRNAIPVFTKDANGKKGMTNRQCTRDYKIYPIRQFVSKYVQKKFVKANSKLPYEKGNIKTLYDTHINMLMGISTDEAHRQKESQIPYITHQYPLIDRGISRQDCLDWMLKNGYPKPPRSACYFCPYHSDYEWLNLPKVEFEKAVQFEKDLQKKMEEQEVLKATPYLHASLVPLDRVKFKESKNKHLMGNECEGMCGI